MEVTDSEINDSSNPLAEKQSTWSKAFSFLEASMSDTSFGIKSAIVGSLLYGTDAVTGVNRYGYGGLRTGIKYLSNTVLGWLPASLTDFTEAAGGASNGAIELIATYANALLDELKNPNVGGIPIHADSEVESQDVAVNKNLLIVEEAGNKDSVVDNAVPQLKTWQVKGYLMSNPNVFPLAGSLVIKPDLILQRKLLDQYANSRKPLIFKTHDNRFFKVQITHMDTAYSVQGTNALGINLTLQEYKVLAVQDAALGLTAFAKES